MAPPSDADYAAYLLAAQERGWKRLCGVQRPYRWLVRRLAVGRVLEIGCGVGRNLAHLQGRAVGVDTNAACVGIAKQRGFLAYTPEEFQAAGYEPGSFGTLLASHVLEHIGRERSPAVLAAYLRWLSPRGRLVAITPQEAGYRLDPTHIEFMGFSELRDVAEELGFVVKYERSFPFPAFIGRVFPYNEFVVVGDRAA